MKTLKALLATSLLAMVSAPAFAATVVDSDEATVIHIGGSTAFRAAVNNAIVRLMAANGTCQVAYTGTSGISGANAIEFKGTITGVGACVVKASWNGSLTGIAGVVTPGTSGNANVPAKFSYLSDDAFNSTATYQTATAGTQVGFTTQFGLAPGAQSFASTTPFAATNTGTAVDTVANRAPDFALSDAYQSSTPFSTTNGYPALNDTLVGIIPFTWVKSAAASTDVDYISGGWGRLSNITSLQARALLASANGQITAADLTDVSTDTFNVCVTGRDYDSGTRFDTLCEIEGKTAAQSAVANINQWVGGSASPTAFILNSTSLYGGYATVDQSGNGNNFPVSSALTTSLPANGGFNSGGKMLAALQDLGFDTANSDFGGYVIAYTGAADADTVIGVTPSTAPSGYVPVAALNFNGVTLSKANVANGTYSFWTREHFLTPSTISGNAALLAPVLSADLISTDAAVAGYLINGTLKAGVSRGVEGSTITLP